MSRKRFVVLDRDGTIIAERHYLSDPDFVELIPKATEGMRQLAQIGLGLIMVTNQSGVCRGYFSKESVESIHQRLISLLEREGVHLDGIYYCPHTPESGCLCRKPGPGLLILAAKELNFEAKDCFVVGDNVCDIELGQRVGAATLLVLTGYGAQVAARSEVIPDHVVSDLWEASQVIKRLVEERSIGG